MPELPLRYFCYVCGQQNDLVLDIPNAPEMSRNEITCPACGDVTNLLLTACPHCNNAFKYFLSDLDFPHELTSLATVYVKLISRIKNSLAGIVKEFNVSVPKRWSVNLDCQCGEKYSVEIPLPQLH
jgi:predicted nucleic acid-binding Zn ribbon protein